MWEFLCGFSAGIYVGTYYNCKPCIKFIVQFVKDHISKEEEET